MARNLRMRAWLIASVATVLGLGVLTAGLVSSPGWPSISESFFSWHYAKEAFPDVARGIWLNIKIFVIAEILILVVGCLVAVARSSTSPALAPIRLLSTIYTDVFRGLPTLLVVLMLGLGMPGIGLQGLPKDAIFWGGTALVLCYGAYVAEVIRSGIDSIHPSQILSADSLGLNHRQSMQYVVLPQAFRRVVPPLLNDFVSLQKDTALVSVLGIFEGLSTANDKSLYAFNYTPYVVAGIFFVAMTIPMARLTDWLAKRARMREWGRLR